MRLLKFYINRRATLLGYVGQYELNATLLGKKMVLFLKCFGGSARECPVTIIDARVHRAAVLAYDCEIAILRYWGRRIIVHAR